MLEDRDERIPFILNWIKLFEIKDKKKVWSTEFIGLIEEHIEDPKYLNEISGRLTTGPRIGSYADKLELALKYIKELEKLQKNPHVSSWAGTSARQLLARIVDERRLDGNDSAGYRR